MSSPEHFGDTVDWSYVADGIERRMEATGESRDEVEAAVMKYGEAAVYPAFAEIDTEIEQGELHG